MASTRSSRSAASGASPTRSSGRPTVEAAAELDRDLREAALQLFLERGYDNTSMKAIAAAAQTTRRSLYARYPNKAVMFQAVLDWVVERTDWPYPEPDPPDLDDFQGALTAIAEASVRRALDPASIKLGRLAVAQASSFPDIAQRTDFAANRPRQALVVRLLKHHAATGAITADEPEILAEHFLAMVGERAARRASLGIWLDEETQHHHIRVAVEMFMRSLRPD